MKKIQKPELKTLNAVVEDEKVKSILKWIKEKETLANSKLKIHKEDNELAFATYLGMETAYSTTRIFIETLTGVKLEDEKR